MDECMAKVRTLAIDLAKSVFQVAGEDAQGAVVFEERIKTREAFVRFLRTLEPPVEVLMETGPGAQSWARELQSRGINVRVLPAQRVEEHRSGAKNDRKDTFAILRAGRDRSIHAVPVKSVEHLTMQALHRVRSGYVSRRTAISNQIRGLLTEHGVVFARGEVALAGRLPLVLEDASLPIPFRLRDLIAELWAEWEQLGARIDVLDGELQREANGDEQTRCLMTIPGVGPLTATALACKDLDPKRFADARQFAAYFGVVPDQASSGQRIRLMGMSKRGDGYVRSLLINGAHAVLRQVDRAGGSSSHAVRLRRWKEKHGSKAAAVRLANRNLRIVYALLKHGGRYREDAAMK